MMVLAIIALIGGLSAGAFQLARRSYALSACASRVEVILRAARNAAVSSGVPSRVVIDTEPPRATAYGFESMGEWGFEEEEGGVAYGARRLPATLEGGASLGKGYSGSGLHLQGGGYADCGNRSVYDLRAGVYAEAWVKWSVPSGPLPRAGSASAKGTGASAGKRLLPPRSAPSSQKALQKPAPSTRRPLAKSSAGEKAAKQKEEPAQGHWRPAFEVIPLEDATAILSKGSSYFLGIGRDGSLEGRIGTYRARTYPGAVLPGRWTKIALSFDGEEVLLIADGIERDGVLLDRPATEKDLPPPPSGLPPSGEPFLIGPREGGSVDIDEVRLYGMVEPLSHELGGRERFLGWKKVIRFDRRGRLDPRFHEVGVNVLLYEEEDREPTSLRTEVAVDYTVTYAEWARRRGLAVEEEGEAAAEEKLLAKIGGARRVAIGVDPSGALR